MRSKTFNKVSIVKRILIDANPTVPYLVSGRMTGIGRTNLELINSLGKIRESLPFEVALYTQNLKGVSAKQLRTGFKSVHAYLRNNEKGNLWAKRLRLREILGRYDLQHITHNYEQVVDPSRCIVTVHDAFYMKFEVENFDYTAYRKTYPPFIQKCRHIITCSESSKSDIVETMGIDPSKVTVIPWGVDHDSLYVERDLAETKRVLSNELGLERPYFLSVSCDAGRKRTPEFIKAYLAIQNPKNDLVLVWGNVPEYVRASVKGNPRIHFLSGVSADNLRRLYNCATASINPTSYEGFGLPILEAMACACPAITCHNSSLPEVGADVAIYIDEPISSSLPKLLLAIEAGKVDLKTHALAGPQQAARFTWERSASLTARVYEQELDKIHSAR